MAILCFTIAFQERIRSLNWVTMGFLETALDFSSEPVQELLNEVFAIHYSLGHFLVMNLQ